MACDSKIWYVFSSFSLHFAVRVFFHMQRALLTRLLLPPIFFTPSPNLPSSRTRTRPRGVPRSAIMKTRCVSVQRRESEERTRREMTHALERRWQCRRNAALRRPVQKSARDGIAPKIMPCRERWQPNAACAARRETSNQRPQTTMNGLNRCARGATCARHIR